ncbi:MAG: IS200/IS605 family element transposase accessory protein TnpB [Candidatus Aenigmarchaeota archaeon]|nr:IS200/IS605 family element transposase accessory protein TnpB [Candidatus Aenigmarchaeota archaeon]
MFTCYKFRLYPSNDQERKLLWVLEKCRFLYNKLLENMNNNKTSRRESQHTILIIKKENPELCKIYSKVLQYENWRLFSNLHSLYMRKSRGKKAGKLRFKGKQWFKSFTYSQSGFTFIKNNTRYDKLRLSKIGEVPLIMHREVEGEIKQLTVKKQSSGKWFVLIISEVTKQTNDVQKIDRVGIDLGTMNYAYDSDGNHFENPKNLDGSIEKLKREQRQLSRKVRGSKNWRKHKIKVARTHENIVSRRTDFLHKLSGYYVNRYGFIAVENLRMSGMVRHPRLSKSISDASWSRFITMLEYKAERAGIRVVKVEPRNTSQNCSGCGSTVTKRLWVRTHACLQCGLTIDRDYNSAINILNKALLPERQEVTPVEIGPLLNNEQVRSRKQELEENKNLTHRI